MSGQILKKIAVFVVAASLLFSFIIYRFYTSKQSTPSGKQQGNEVTQDAPVYLEFTRSGITEAMAQQVEIVARPKKAMVALTEMKDGGRFACVVVDGPAGSKCYELDRDLEPSHFVFLQRVGFVSPSEIVSRVMSRYRSVAKSAMNFDPIRDRMIVLICPQSEWARLKVEIPIIPSPPSAPAVQKNDPNERF